MGQLYGFFGSDQTQSPPAAAENASDDAQRVLAAASVGYLTADYAKLSNSDAVRAMNRQAWAACDDPLAMLCFLSGRAGGRKFRLFATACARDEFANGTIPEGECPPARMPQYYARIEAAEAFADGGPRLRPSLLDGVPFHWAAQQVCDVISDEDVAHAALGFNADVGLWTTPIEEIVPVLIRRYRTHPSHYLRDLFGFVFHEAPLNPACQTPTVLAVAQAAYEDRLIPIGHLHQDRLAVLADALEDAACADADLLSHLRSAGPHVRGCWALDLVLGKQ